MWEGGLQSASFVSRLKLEEKTDGFASFVPGRCSAQMAGKATDPENLGELTEVPVRSVWKDEARDFTPWLAEEANMALLADTLEIGAHIRPPFRQGRRRFSARTSSHPSLLSISRASPHIVMHQQSVLIIEEMLELCADRSLRSGFSESGNLYR